ncbi:MAG: rubrerythrin family protein [Sedimentibacter sp.]
MANNFKQSKTYENLQKSFEREMQESSKYLIYGEKARQDGYEQIGNVFEDTARTDRAHGEIWFKLLNNGQMPSTLENLEESYNYKCCEWTDMYIDYATTARAEGYPDIANLFNQVAHIEMLHDYKFDNMAENIRNNQVFCKDNKVAWVCLSCGNLVWNECAPEICPVCGYPRGYHQLNGGNYY